MLSVEEALTRVLASAQPVAAEIIPLDRAAGRILAVPFSKGSSTTTAVLLEAVRAGTAPAAILTTGADAFFALASIVADVMYGKSFPVVALEPEDFASLRTGERLTISRDGRVLRSDC